MPPLPQVRVAHPHVVLDPEQGPIVASTRVPVRRLYAWHKQGTAVETILKRYPALGPARLLDALAFAYDNLDLIEADLARERSALAREDGTSSDVDAPLSAKQRVAEARRAQQNLPFKKD